MTTTVLQFTPEVQTIASLTCGDVSASGQIASPQPTFVMSPVVQQDGTPVTPDALVIDTLPLHGVATVSGINLTYQANAGYIGADSFLYHAVVGSSPSNGATASLQIYAKPLGPSIQKQHRLLAYLYADTVLDMFCRSDVGPLDLTGYDLAAWIHPYQRPQPWGIDYGPGMAGYFVPWQTEIAAQQIAVGHVQATIDHGTIRARLGAGLWRLHLVATDPNTQARTRVYTALLTIQ